MLAHVFNVVGPHNVMLGVFEFDRAAVRAHKKAGFRKSVDVGKATFGDRMWDDTWIA